MKELILPPVSRTTKDASPDRPGEIFIDPSDRRFSGQSGRRPGALLFLAVIAAAGVYAFHRASDAPKPNRPAAPNEAALIEKTQQQITVLQTEVRELRAKLDAAETRLSAAALAPPPAAETKAATLESAPQAPTAKEPVAATPPAAPSKSAAAEPSPVQSVAQTPKVLDAYRLREVSHGVAILETRRGVVAVRVGDVLTDAGQVKAIQKRAGRWIVSTESGDIAGDAQARPAAARRRPVYREQYGYMPERFMPRLFMPF